jgi:hypothetical protein
MALLMKNGALLAHYFQGRLALTEDADICDCECGPPGCILGSDNFNRANSAVNEIGPKWEALAGEWRIHNNRLVCDDPGVLATTICHPLAYPLGAWWVNVKLTNLGTVGLYKIRAGHPTQSVYEVHFEVKGSGVNRAIEVTVIGDDIESFEFPFGEEAGDVAEAVICYAPGVELSANIGVGDILVTACISDDNAGRCFALNGDSVGNFAFLEGNFDDWNYEAHFIENEDCRHCDCFCYQKLGNDRISTCIPKLLHLTLSNELYCPGLAGTYEMHQKADIATPTDSTMKYSWISEDISCLNPFFTRFELICQFKLDGTIRGAFTMVAWRQNGAEIKFDPLDPDTIGTDGNGNTRAGSKSNSTCSPLMLVFPDLLEDLVSGGFANYCCGEDHTDDEQTNPRAGVVVTI